MVNVVKISEPVVCNRPDAYHYLRHPQELEYNVVTFLYDQCCLSEEVEKRTSYLGKFRGSDIAEHLLELIAMTADEHDLFLPFMRSSMADVYDTLNMCTLGIEKKYEVRTDEDDHVFITYEFKVPINIDLSAVESLDNAILEALVNHIIWKWLVYSYPDDAKSFDTMYNDSLDSIKLRCNVFNRPASRIPRVF